MDANYWQQRWDNNDIGFHEVEPNARLVRYLSELNLAKGSRIFVPLCGKTFDIAWLLSNGYRVAGVDISKLAVTQLFSENGLDPEISNCGSLDRYSHEGIDIFVGDVLDMTRTILGAVSGVYDRGALVAIPPNRRASYAQHLTGICQKAPQLLITCNYDHRKIKGSPFPVGRDEVQRCYGESYNLTHAESAEIPGGLKGIRPARTDVWILQAAVRQRS